MAGRQWRFDDLGDHLDKLNADIWSILIEKCIGEAYEKVKSAGEGEGITGYLVMHEWFTKTTDFVKTFSNAKPASAPAMQARA